MGRRSRRVFNFVSAASLGLFVILAVAETMAEHAAAKAIPRRRGVIVHSVSPIEWEIGGGRRIVAPHAVGLASILPMIWFIWRIGLYYRGKRKPGACSHCSYDLTGNVSGICPECGTPVKKRVTT